MTAIESQYTTHLWYFPAVMLQSGRFYSGAGHAHFLPRRVTLSPPSTSSCLSVSSPGQALLSFLSATVLGHRKAMGPLFGIQFFSKLSSWLIQSLFLYYCKCPLNLESLWICSYLPIPILIIYLVHIVQPVWECDFASCLSVLISFKFYPPDISKFSDNSILSCLLELSGFLL